MRNKFHVKNSYNFVIEKWQNLNLLSKYISNNLNKNYNSRSRLNLTLFFLISIQLFVLAIFGIANGLKSIQNRNLNISNKYPSN